MKLNLAKLSAVLFTVVMVITSNPYANALDNTVLKTETIKFGILERTVSYIKVDLSNHGIQIKSSVANNYVGSASTLDKMANLLKEPDNRVVAAINGTFFSAYDGNPVPWGTIGKNGKVIHIGNYGTQIGIDAENKVLIEHIDTAVKGSINGVQDRWYAWNLNHSYDNADAVAILTPEYGAETYKHNFTSIVVRSGNVTSIQIGQSSIPKDGYVIVTGFQQLIDRFNVGDEVDYKIVFSAVDYSTNPATKNVTSQWDKMMTTIGQVLCCLKMVN